MGGPFYDHLSIVILGLVPRIYRVDWLAGGWNELAMTEEASPCFVVVPRVRRMFLVRCGFHRLQAELAALCPETCGTDGPVQVFPPRIILAALQASGSRISASLRPERRPVCGAAVLLSLPQRSSRASLRLLRPAPLLGTNPRNRHRVTPAKRSASRGLLAGREMPSPQALWQAPLGEAWAPQASSLCERVGRDIALRLSGHLQAIDLYRSSAQGRG